MPIIVQKSRHNFGMFDILEHCILLYECMRLKTEDDKLKLKNVKILMFKLTASIKSLIESYM